MKTLLIAAAMGLSFVLTSAAAAAPQSSTAWLTDAAYHAQDTSAADATSDIDYDTDFAKGTWTAQFYGSATLGDVDGEVYAGHASVGYYLLDGLSFNVGLVGGQIDSDETFGDDGYIYGAEMLLRWHFYQQPDWSLYLDGGLGFTWSEHPFPANGTHQNFNPQLGLGFTVDLFDPAKVMIGARWHHISNANRSGGDENPGFDGVMVYAGLMMPF